MNLKVFSAKFQKLDISFLLVCFLAVALQAQVSVLISDDYAGLRMGLADLILPLAGLYVLFSLLSKRSIWPQWSVKHMVIWLVALVGVMSGSLYVGYVYQGGLSDWALVNKYAGFFVLLAYFGLGGWIATNRADIIGVFVKALCGVCLAVLVMSAVGVLAGEVGVGGYPWDGFMANRNAFMVLFICVLVFVVISDGDQSLALPSWFYPVFWALLPFFVVYNSSRTGWIVGGVILMVAFFTRSKRAMRLILPCLVLGSGIVYGALSFVGTGSVMEASQIISIVDYAQGTGNIYDSDVNRMMALKDGWAFYAQSNPFWGAGLGSYLAFQEEQYGQVVDIIDFTGLWLLVEAGVLGFLVFVGFSVVCLWALYKSGFQGAGSGFHKGLFWFLIAFVIMSCLHELMYTRFFWFVMGLGLAIPVKSGSGGGT